MHCTAVHNAIIECQHGCMRQPLVQSVSFVNKGDKVLIVGATANDAFKLMHQVALKSLE